MASAVTDVETSAPLNDVRESQSQLNAPGAAQTAGQSGLVSGIVSNGGAVYGETPYKLQHGIVVSESGKSASVSNNNNNYTVSGGKRVCEQFLGGEGAPVANPESTGPLVSNMPKNSNEPVKVVYPTGGGHGQTSAPTVLNMNNRVTFTGQTLPNGTISLSPITTQATIMQTTANAKGPQTSQNQQSQPSQSQSTIVIKNQVSMAPGITSAPPGMVTMTKTINQVNITSLPINPGVS